MNITATLIKVMDAEQVSDKFKKREFVVEYKENPLYPQAICFQLIQDKTDLIDGFAIGQEVEITFNLKGREWTSPQGQKKYFNTLEAWKIAASQGRTAPEGTIYTNDDNPNFNDPGLGGDGDLPF